MKRKSRDLFLMSKSVIAKILAIVMILALVMVEPSVTTKAATAPKLAKTSIKLTVGDQYELKVSNKVKNSSYKWNSNNKKVATVSKKGVVTGVGKGATTITCKVTTSSKKYNLSGKVTVSEVVQPTTDNNGKTANEMVKELGNGWNLGNTMEAVSTWLSPNATALDYEKSWQQPTTTKEMITGLKESGFNSIRIPVAWSNMMSTDGNYTISDSYFNRIDQIIGYVLDNNMYAIINIHWDGGWWEEFGSADEAVRKAAMAKYSAIWTQLAIHYKSYSDHLIFESANEELGDAFKESLTKDQCYTKTNEINQKFVDIVRASGAENGTRYLLIAGYNTDIDSTSDSRFIMPKDVIKNHLMVSVHYYTPPTYCIANKVGNSWGYMDSWGTDKDKKEMRTYFEKMQKFTKAGYGVVIGEYGVTLKDKDGSWVVKDGTDQFFQSVVALAKEYNYCAMLWDVGDWYGRNECKFKDDSIGKIFK